MSVMLARLPHITITSSQQAAIESERDPPNVDVPHSNYGYHARKRHSVVEEVTQHRQQKRNTYPLLPQMLVVTYISMYLYSLDLTVT